MDILEYITIVTIMLLGGYVAIVDSLFAHTQKHDSFRLIKMAYAGVCVYWILFYATILIFGDFRLTLLSRYFTRLGVILTLTALAMGATARAIVAGILPIKSPILAALKAFFGNLWGKK